jgi:hypothetical protein
MLAETRSQSMSRATVLPLMHRVTLTSLGLKQCKTDPAYFVYLTKTETYWS